MKFQGGPKEAAKMLAGMSLEDRKRILDQIKKTDKKMAMELEKNIISFEDLILLTPKMLVELLREINIKDLGLGLRIGSTELKSYFFKNVSSGIRSEIEDILLGPPKPISQVEESIENIMAVVRLKVAKGELILKEGGEEYI